MAETLGQAVLEVGVDDSRLRAGLAGVERQAKQTANVVNSIFAAAGIVAGAVAATQSFGGFIKAATELEGITRKLTNTLGAQGAQQALGELRSLSERLGVSFTVLADAFGSFTAAASAAGISLRVQKELFEAVSTSAQRLGLSNDAINGSLLALQQVAAKGTVQMEELRGQLGERLPTAFAATAQGLGITSRELIKLVESGKLTADEFFLALTKGLAELNGNGAGGVLTADQNFATFGDRLKDLQAEFGTEFLPGVVATVKQLTELLKEISIQKRSADIGASFGLSGSQSDQIVGRQIDAERRLGLSREQSKNIVSDAIAAADRRAGGVDKTRNLFGQRILKPEEFGSILDDIGTRSETFSRPARAAAAREEQRIANTAAEEAAAARELNTEGKRKERLKTLRKENEGLADNSSKLAANLKEIEQIEAQTAKGSEKLAKAGEKAREEIEKGAKKLAEAGEELREKIVQGAEAVSRARIGVQNAEESRANATAAASDIASDSAIFQDRGVLLGDIQNNLGSGRIDPRRLAQRFGLGFNPNAGGFVEGLDRLDINRLSDISRATSPLADSQQAVVEAQRELVKTQTELTKLRQELEKTNERESNLSITVPVGTTEQVYLP